MKDDSLTPQFFVRSIGIGLISHSIVGFHARCIEYQEHGESFDKVSVFFKTYVWH